MNLGLTVTSMQMLETPIIRQYEWDLIYINKDKEREALQARISISQKAIIRLKQWQAFMQGLNIYNKGPEAWNKE